MLRSKDAKTGGAEEQEAVDERRRQTHCYKRQTGKLMTKKGTMIRLA